MAERETTFGDKETRKEFDTKEEKAISESIHLDNQSSSIALKNPLIEDIVTPAFIEKETGILKCEMLDISASTSEFAQNSGTGKKAAIPGCSKYETEYNAQQKQEDQKSACGVQECMDKQEDMILDESKDIMVSKPDDNSLVKETFHTGEEQYVTCNLCNLSYPIISFTTHSYYCQTSQPEDEPAILHPLNPDSDHILEGAVFDFVKRVHKNP